MERTQQLVDRIIGLFAFGILLVSASGLIVLLI